MLQKTKKTLRRRREARQFQCTGFGDCNMIFSRSEHLARHARKHTGEKPYKCIVVNCDRTFSRVDNMMQHTNTHYRSKKSMQLMPDKSSVSEDTTINNVSQTSPTIPYQPFHPPTLIPSPIYDPRLIQEHYPYYPPVFVPSTGVYQLWPYPSPNASPLPSEPSKNPDSPVKKTFFQNVEDARYVDLTAPIQQLAHTTTDKKEGTTTVTADEYEALEGFGQFCAKPREYKQVPVRLQLSQIHSFRQHLHLVQESFQRNTHIG
ncbi:unnamed protein product [Rhizopus stolonifer]